MSTLANFVFFSPMNHRSLENINLWLYLYSVSVSVLSVLYSNFDWKDGQKRINIKCVRISDKHFQLAFKKVKNKGFMLAKMRNNSAWSLEFSFFFFWFRWGLLFPFDAWCFIQPTIDLHIKLLVSMASGLFRLNIIHESNFHM